MFREISHQDTNFLILHSQKQQDKIDLFQCSHRVEARTYNIEWKSPLYFKDLPELREKGAYKKKIHFRYITIYHL